MTTPTTEHQCRAVIPIKPAPYLLVLSRLCVQRMEALKYKGKRRDDAVLDFFCGAAQGLAWAGNAEAAAHVGQYLYMVLRIQGYSEVLSLANWVEPAA